MCILYIHNIISVYISQKTEKGVGVLICSIFQGIQKQLPFFTAKINQRHLNRSPPCQTQTWTQNHQSHRKKTLKNLKRHHKMQLAIVLNLYTGTSWQNFEITKHEAETKKTGISRFGIRVQAPPAVRCLMTPRSWVVGCDLKWNPQMVPQIFKG